MYGLLLVILCFIDCRGFVSSSPTVTTAKKIQGTRDVDTRYDESSWRVDTSTTTSLNGLFGKKEEESSSQPDLSVPTRVLEIPVSSIKQGGMVSVCFFPVLSLSFID